MYWARYHVSYLRMWKRTAEAIARAVREAELSADVYVVGGAAEGRLTVLSDVDVAVYAEKPMKWRELVELALELEDALGRGVDVVDLKTAPLLLACEVVSRGIVVVDRNTEERVDFEVRVLEECLDFKLRLEKYYNEVLARID